MATDKEGDLPGFFTVYYNPDSLMNILSLSDMRKRFRVTMDTNEEAAMLVHISKDKVMRFVEIGAICTSGSRRIVLTYKTNKFLLTLF